VLKCSWCSCVFVSRRGEWRRKGCGDRRERKCHVTTSEIGLAFRILEGKNENEKESELSICAIPKMVTKCLIFSFEALTGSVPQMEKRLCLSCLSLLYKVHRVLLLDMLQVKTQNYSYCLKNYTTLSFCTYDIYN
jgi:hypothetical protein